MVSTQQTPTLFRPIKHTPHVPGPQQASYYAQRASAPGSLLITEATLISHDAGGYDHVPGVYTDEQIQAWKKVTDAVHAKGSYIFLQLWALGRAATEEILEKQDPPSPYVAASAVQLNGHSKTPRALTEVEIQDYIAAYGKAASNAVHVAGFDGVEIQSANGYLPDQFLQSVSNKRTDRWGGDEEGRTRFLRDIVDVVVEAVGEDRVRVRISPWSTFQDMKMPDPRPTFTYLATALRNKYSKMAYLHVIESRVSGGDGGEERIFISTGGHTRETALQTAEDKGGLVTFGRLYISNPDLPVRLQKDLPLAQLDRSKHYLPGNLTPLRYNDWPFADGSIPDLEVNT